VKSELEVLRNKNEMLMGFLANKHPDVARLIQVKEAAYALVIAFNDEAVGDITHLYERLEMALLRIDATPKPLA
jgi:hypothetical protein